jgi:hypothetical protein
MRALQASLLGGIFFLTTLAGADSRLALNVSPQQSFAPANLNVRLTIEPHEANRVVEVIAESEDFYRSSQVALEGDRGPRTVIVQFRSLPGGEYVVRGVVSDSTGRETAEQRQVIEVIPTGR